MPAPGKDRGLRLRGNIWYIRYCDGSGKRYQESSGSSLKGDARRLLKEREGKIAQGVKVTPKAGQLRFDEAVAAVLTDYEVNGKRSLKKVERHTRLHLNPYFGRRRMADLTTDDFNNYISWRQSEGIDWHGNKNGCANATINRELATVRRAYTLAKQAGTLLHSPYIPTLKEAPPRCIFFEDHEFEAMRSHLPIELRGIVTMAFNTGWREDSEIQTLEWRQVDRKAKVVRLDPGTTKNSEGRTLPYGMFDELVQVFEDAHEQRHRLLEATGELCAYVFHRSGKPIKDMRGAFASACEKAGCPGKVPHDLRRSGVRNLVRAGIPEQTAMKISGHKTRSVFDRYDIVNEEDKAVALGKLAAYRAASSAESGGPILGQSVIFEPKDSGADIAVIQL